MVYPHEEIVGGNSQKVLNACFRLSYEFMFLLEPFGQSSSNYEDTGAPEKVALGIRAFLSSRDNIHMLQSIGEGIINSLTTLGCVAEFAKKYGAKTEFDQKTIDLWDEVSKNLKRSNKRTWDVVISGVNDYMAEFKKKGKQKENTCQTCGLPDSLCICEEVKKALEVHRQLTMKELKKKAIEKSKKGSGKD